MLCIEKTIKLFNLIKLLDYILLNEKENITLINNTFSIYEISRELYSLSSHRYIDNKDYLFNLEMKFSHYIQLLYIKPFFQINVQEKTGMSITKLKKIKKIIRFLNNPILPKIYKQFLIVRITVICKYFNF